MRVFVVILPRAVRVIRTGPTPTDTLIPDLEELMRNGPIFLERR